MGTLGSIGGAPLHLGWRCGAISWGVISYPQIPLFVVPCTSITPIPAPMLLLHPFIPLLPPLSLPPAPLQPDPGLAQPGPAFALSFAGKLSHIGCPSPIEPSLLTQALMVASVALCHMCAPACMGGAHQHLGGWMHCVPVPCCLFISGRCSSTSPEVPGGLPEDVSGVCRQVAMQQHVPASHPAYA